MVLSIKLKFDMCILNHRFCTILILMCVIIVFYSIHKMSYITAYRLKIFECVLALLNYLNVYKINVWYTSFIMYDYRWQCVQHLIFFLLENLKLFCMFLSFFVYMLKHSLIKFCLLSYSNQIFGKLSGDTPDFLVLVS